MSRLFKVEFSITKVRSEEYYQRAILVGCLGLGTFLVPGSLVA